MSYWNCGICLIGKDIEAVNTTCPFCGHSQTDSLNIAAIQDKYLPELELEEILVQLNDKLNLKWLHQDQREEIKDAIRRYQHLKSLIEAAERALESENYDKAEDIYRDVFSKLNDQKAKDKILKELAKISPLKLIKEEQSKKRRQRIKKVLLAVSIFFILIISTLYLIVWIKQRNFQVRADRLIKSGYVSVAVRECEDKASKTKSKFYSEYLKYLVEREKSLRNEAELYYNDAKNAYEQGKYIEAETKIAKGIELIKESKYIDLQKKIEEGKRLSLNKERENTKNDLLRKIPMSVKNAMVNIELNQAGYLEGDIVTGIRVIYIPSGEFYMGKNESRGDNSPRHRVYLDAYWISKKEIKIRNYLEYIKSVGKNMMVNGSIDLPVTNISWDEADRYCEWLGRVSGLSIALPTEAQWEKAAITEDYGTRDKGRVIYFNKYGIDGMYDEVKEWCYDFYDEKYYSRSPYKNPKGPEVGNYYYAVVRGSSKIGSEGRPDITLRFKGKLSPSFTDKKIGFRIVIK